MAFDWLFGPEGPSLYPDRLNLRAYTLDIDVVPEVLVLCEEERHRLVTARAIQYQQSPPATSSAEEAANADFPQLKLSVIHPVPIGVMGGQRIVSAGDLQALSAYDRSGLSITGAVHMSFMGAVQPGVNGSRDFTEKVKLLLRGNGRPRVQWIRLTRFLPVVVVALFAGAQLWYALTERVSAPEWVLGLILLAVLAALGVVAHRKLAQRLNSRWLGHRFREASRAETRTRIANSKATIIVSLSTAAVTIPAGYFLQLLLPLP